MAGDRLLAKSAKGHIMSEFKAGDKVRVIGKTRGGSMENMGVCMGDVGVYKNEYLSGCHSVKSDKWQLGFAHFAPQDLEHIEKGDFDMPKYKSTMKNRSFSSIYLEVYKSDCAEVVNHFADLVSHINPESLNHFILFDALIPWAEQDPKRIKWLLDKGYIEEVQNKTDQWIKACPYNNPKSSGPGWLDDQERVAEYIDWAKRRPLPEKP